MTITCPKCHGSKARPRWCGSDYIEATCATCDGTGLVTATPLDKAILESGYALTPRERHIAEWFYRHSSRSERLPNFDEVWEELRTYMPDDFTTQQAIIVMDKFGMIHNGPCTCGLKVYGDPCPHHSEEASK